MDIWNTDNSDRGSWKGRDGKGYVWTFDGLLQNLGFEQLADLATPAKNLTVPAGTTVILLNITAQAVRMRTDGTAASATVGLVIPAETLLWWSGPFADVSLFEVIAGGEANIEYYGPAQTG